MREKELVDILKRIQRLCNTHGSCKDCQMGNDNDKCMLRVVPPYSWDIQDPPPEEPWRAIK